MMRCLRCGRPIHSSYRTCYLCFRFYQEHPEQLVRKCGLCGTRTKIPINQTLCYPCWLERIMEEREATFKLYVSKRPSREMPQTGSLYGNNKSPKARTRKELELGFLDVEEIPIRWINPDGTQG